MASLTSACAWQYADWNVQGPGSKEDIEDDGDGPQCSVLAQAIGGKRQFDPRPPGPAMTCNYC